MKREDEGLCLKQGERLVLYKGEIRSYDLSEGQDISRDTLSGTALLMFLENGRQSGRCIC